MTTFPPQSRVWFLKYIYSVCGREWPGDEGKSILKATCMMRIMGLSQDSFHLPQLPQCFLFTVGYFPFLTPTHWQEYSELQQDYIKSLRAYKSQPLLLLCHPSISVSFDQPCKKDFQQKKKQKREEFSTESSRNGIPTFQAWQSKTYYFPSVWISSFQDTLFNKPRGAAF